MLSLNQIVKQLQTLRTTNLLLSNGSFLFGDPWEYGASNQIQYPLMGVRLISSGLGDKQHTTSLNIYFADLVKKDEGNETDVLSDMQQAATRLYSEFKEQLEDNYPATLSVTSSFTPFTERWDDEVSGVEVNMNIEQFFDNSTCS